MMQLTDPVTPTEHWGQLTAIPGTIARLAPWPIPQDSIIEGAPTARGRILARDGRTVAGLWECEAGRLELVVEGDEMLVVLSGRLVIQTGQGETLLLEAGDVACLPDGTDCAVTVTDRCRCAFQTVAPPAVLAPPV